MSTATTPRPGRTLSVRGGGGLSTRQRRPGWAAAALVLVIGLAVLAGWQYQKAGEKSPVVVVTGTVAEGHVITREDLSSVAVAGGVTAIGANGLESVVGQRAAVTLLPGTLLQRSMLTAAGSLTAAQARVGVALTSAQLPADDVAAGDTVQVLQLPPSGARAGATAAAPQLLVDAARVWSARADPGQSGGILVTLTVPKEAGAAVAAASGAGQVALVKVAAGQ